jgi:hypothetical protein
VRLSASSTGLGDRWGGWARRRGDDISRAAHGQQQSLDPLHDNLLTHTESPVRRDSLPQLTLHQDNARFARFELAPDRANGAEQAFAPGDHAPASSTQHCCHEEEEEAQQERGYGHDRRD